MERNQLSIAADEYQAKLASAEMTISQLQAQVTRMSRDAGSTPNEDEMASMKFAKEALETKLRKYAAYCQRLENEKANVLDALKSVNGSDIEDGDVTRAIIALCDKQSSLEEECEALTSAEQKASSYLSELDHLRETNSHLQHNFLDAENKLAKLTHAEADLTRKLDDAKEKVASLRKERDHLKAVAESERGNVADLESEKSRQVRYLEQENLQLMFDLKNAKKQLKSTRAQLDAMRMTVVDDETGDFGSIAANAFNASRAGSGDMKSVDSSDPVSPVDKENQHENVAGRGAEQTHGTESARKRRFPSVNRSAKKVRNTASRTLGLGEAGSVNEDHTGECKQS
jgi:chromosome segregation ATPase